MAIKRKNNAKLTPLALLAPVLFGSLVGERMNIVFKRKTNARLTPLVAKGWCLGRSLRLLFFVFFAMVIWPSPGTAGSVFTGLGDFFGDSKSIAKLKAEFDLSPGDASALDWSQDGKFLAVTGILNTEVRVFDVQNKKLTMILKKLAGGSQGLAYSPDGRFIAAGHAFTQRLKGVSIFVWDAKTGALVKSITGPFPIDNPANSVTYLAFSPDGRYLAVGYRGNFPHSGDNIYLYDTGIWAPIKSFGNAKELVQGGLIFSPDGRHIAHGTLTGEIFIWDASNGKLTKRIKAYSGYLESLAYSPDGKWIASSTDTGTVRGTLNEITRKREETKNEEQVKVWKIVNESAPGRTVEGFTAPVRGLAFSRDGKYFAAGSRRTVKIWFVKTWQVVATLPTAAAPMSIKFSPDGQNLAIGSGMIAAVWVFKK